MAIILTHLSNPDTNLWQFSQIILVNNSLCVTKLKTFEEVCPGVAGKFRARKHGLLQTVRYSP